MNFNAGPFGGHQNSVGSHVHQSLLRWFPVKIHSQMFMWAGGREGRDPGV